MFKRYAYFSHRHGHNNIPRVFIFFLIIMYHLQKVKESRRENHLQCMRAVHTVLWPSMRA